MRVSFSSDQIDLAGSDYQPMNPQSSSLEERLLTIGPDSVHSDQRAPQNPPAEKCSDCSLLDFTWAKHPQWLCVWVGFVCFAAIVVCCHFGVKLFIVNVYSDIDSLRSNFTPTCLLQLLIILIVTLVLIYICYRLLDPKDTKTNERLPFLWFESLVLCIVAFGCILLGQMKILHDNGVGSAFWCIIFGAILRNLFPSFEKRYSDNKGLDLEFFIKVSLVLLAINLKQILELGPRGLLVAWVDTLILIGFLFFFGTLVLGMSTPHAMITSTGVSVCGSSAALAIADLFPEDNKKFAKSLITIMSLVTIPHIPLMPFVARRLGMNPNLAGAWIGGSVDSTGAVMASANLGGIDVLHAAVILKMLQNILISPLCLGIGLFVSGDRIRGKGWRKYLLVMWEKFPKFVLGFLVTAIITTLLPSDMNDAVTLASFNISEWFSNISFVLIGMDIDFKTALQEFSLHRSMVYLYLLGQSIDLFTTIGFALVVFK